MEPIERRLQEEPGETSPEHAWEPSYRHVARSKPSKEDEPVAERSYRRAEPDETDQVGSRTPERVEEENEETGAPTGKEEEPDKRTGAKARRGAEKAARTAEKLRNQGSLA